MSFVFRMVWRETRAAWMRLGFFFLCVGLGVASIVSLRSVVQHVRATLTREARTLIASDIILQSQRPFGPEIAAKIDTLKQTAGIAASIDAINTQTMAAAVEGKGNGQVKLVELRGVEAAFPFYGELLLQDGAVYSHDLLKDHGVVVAPELLTGLDLQVGDPLRLAGQTFNIRAAIARDRVQGSGGLAFGPRVYLDLAALRQTALLGFGSRATYQTLFKLDDGAPVAGLTGEWTEAFKDTFVSVRSWQTLEDRIGRNLTTAENYLSLVGFAIVVLGGLGVWSVTRVIVQQKIRSVAILKCLGASGGLVLGIYLLQVILLAAAGSGLGLGLAWGVLATIPARTLQPLGVTEVRPTLSACLQGLSVGLLVSLLFGLVPLLDIRKVKPLLLLRAHSKTTSGHRDWWGWVAGAGIGLCLALVASWQAGSWQTGLAVSAGLGVVTGVLYIAGHWLVRLTGPLTSSSRFPVRHATVSLRRPGNQTRVILMAVGLGCFFMVSVRATQSSLLGELSTQVGDQSPDLVLIDVQNDQVDGVKAVAAPYLRRPARVAPLMRGRITAVRGRRVELPTLEAVMEHRSLRREFGLTFRTHLESNERLLSGTTWSTPLESETLPAVAGAAPADTEMTIEEDLARSNDLSIGDVVDFDVAGQAIRARIVGVRNVEWEDSQNGGFVFVLRPAPAVSRAGHTYVGFMQVTEGPTGRGALQRDLVKQFPNVSVIDVRDILASIRDVVDNVTLGITVVGAVTLIGGALILVGAVAMTKFERLYETAIYRTLGASARLVTMMLAVEYGMLGTLAGVLGTLGGLALSWGLARYLFEIPWDFPMPLATAGVAGTGLGVALIGVIASVDVVLKKPLATLRSE
jgi:putative ABC transport system permease protein